MNYRAIHKLFLKIKSGFKPTVKNINTQDGYPNPYYMLVYKAMQELLSNNNPQLKFLESSIIGGGWLLDGTSGRKIADETYRYLWYNLIFAVKNEKDDAIMTYWNNAFQYFQYSLREIEKVRDAGVFSNVLNLKEIKQRKIERIRFLEFHYALGGLLFYKKRYSCIKRIFEFTNSEPPTFALFPINITEIFCLYFDFKASYAQEMTFISAKYPFPDMEGIRTDDKIRNWICKYLSCLLLRQYTLYEYYTYQKHVDLPKLPESLREMSVWLDYIEIFKESVELIYSDSVLLKELGLETVNDKEILKNGKLLPNEIFERTQEKLREEILKSTKSQELSTSKIDEFKINCKKIIINGFNQLQALFNTSKIDKNFEVKQINGIDDLFDRLAFCDDTDVSYLNAETILATSYSLNWQLAFSWILYRMKSKTYVLIEENFFKGIENLGLSKEDHLIIAFGFNMEFFITYKKIPGLEKGNYQGIPIYEYNTFNPILSQSVLIVKKSDLPSVDYLDISAEEKMKFGFNEPIDEKYKLYADIIDFNTNPELIDEYKKRYPNKDISKSVLTIIDLFTEIRWKRDAVVIQIQMDSDFEQRGLPNTLADIKKLT